MAEDWLIDVQKYDPNANPEVVSAIVRYCGIALHNRDSSLVSFTSPEELDRVRENYLKKKLGRTEPDSALDEAIAAVGQIMQDDRTKNRVTVYYLLARNFDQLHLFEGSGASQQTGAPVPTDSGADDAGDGSIAAPAGSGESGSSPATGPAHLAGAAAAGAAGAGAAALAAGAADAGAGAAAGAGAPDAAAGAGAADAAAEAGAGAGATDAAAGAGAAAAALAAGGAAAGAASMRSSDQDRVGQEGPSAAPSEPARSPAGGNTIGSTPQAPDRLQPDRLVDEPARTGSKWWLWLILLAVALLALFLLLRSCGYQAGIPSALQTGAASSEAQADGNLSAAPGGTETAAPAAPDAATAGAQATAPPAGAGVVAEVQNGLPALKVYFDVGKSAVSADLANASKALRDYTQAHPSAHVVVSGYNDPTGNAALNAALSKSRAQNVAAALAKAGLPASAITLEKPANATSSSTGTESRRVEVTVRP